MTKFDPITWRFCRRYFFRSKQFRQYPRTATAMSLRARQICRDDRRFGIKRDIYSLLNGVGRWLALLGKE